MRGYSAPYKGFFPHPWSEVEPWASLVVIPIALQPAAQLDRSGAWAIGSTLSTIGLRRGI